MAKVQRWTNADRETQRRALHARAGCPASMKEFDRKGHFDAYLRECEALKNRVDIRERERERVEVIIERLNAALHEATGKDYARGILLDMSDVETTDRLALDPIADQIERGEATYDREKYGKRGGYQGAVADLDNLLKTLKNRLSKLLTKIKAEKHPCPPGREWWVISANNPVIDAILAGKVCVRFIDDLGHVAYRQITEAQYRARKSQPTTPPEPTKAPVPIVSYTPERAARFAKIEENCPF